MKKLGLIYRLSFLPYTVILCALFHFRVFRTAEEIILAVLVLLMTAGFVYRLLYVVFLRRKENISLPRSIAQFFLYIFLSIGLFAAFIYIYAFFAGFRSSTWLGYPPIVTTYYGLEAWKCLNGWYIFVMFIPAVIYGIAYFCITRHIKIKESKPIFKRS